MKFYALFLMLVQAANVVWYATSSDPAPAVVALTVVGLAYIAWVFGRMCA